MTCSTSWTPTTRTPRSPADPRPRPWPSLTVLPWPAGTGSSSTSTPGDLDGGPADETMRFWFAGAVDEIDLSNKNSRAFRQQLTPLIEHACKAARGQPRRSARTAASRQRTSDIRAWAKDHGIADNERERIPASVMEQYETATKGRCTRRLPRGPLPCMRPPRLGRSLRSCCIRSASPNLDLT